MEKFSCKLVAIDSNWDQYVCMFKHDVYHLSGWLNASKLIEKDAECKGLVIEMKGMYILIPLLCQNISNSWWDARSAYGYGGPLVDSRLTTEQIEFAFDKSMEFLKEQGCISLFIRLHPLLNEKFDVKLGYFVEHGVTLSIDLDKTEEEHWKETQNRHRRGINKAIKQGITTTIEPLKKDNIDTFFKIYHETMEYLDAEEFYFFSKEYFTSLAENLSNNLILINAYDGEIAVASSIYSFSKESLIMQFHLGGTLNNYRDLQPSKLITHVAREWGRSNSYKQLHLGGGVGAKKDSLYEYKKGFGADEYVFRTFRLILNLEQYKSFSEAKGHILNNDYNYSGFFPLYRS